MKNTKILLFLVILSSVFLSGFVNAVVGVDDATVAAGIVANYCISNMKECIDIVKTPFKKFEFSVSPIQVNSRNCEQSEPISIKVNNPFWLSSVIVYANGQQICKIGNTPVAGQEQTCSFSFKGGNAGSSGTETVNLVVAAVGEPGSNDAGKGDSRQFSIRVTHVATVEEQNSRGIINSAKSTISKSEEKISTYETQGYVMKNARRLLTEANRQISNSENVFSNCDFGNVRGYVNTAETKAQSASSQADTDYQNGLKAKDAINSAKSNIARAQAKIDSYTSSGYDMINASNILSEAKKLLNSANNYFSAGDYSTASDYATQASSKSEEAINQADLYYQKQKSNKDKQVQSEGAFLAYPVLLFIGIIILVLIVYFIFAKAKKKEILLVCPKCKSKNQENSKFCNDCGEKLQ